jgi:hypothetical protein
MVIGENEGREGGASQLEFGSKILEWHDAVPHRLLVLFCTIAHLC